MHRNVLTAGQVDGSLQEAMQASLQLATHFQQRTQNPYWWRTARRPHLD